MTDGWYRITCPDKRVLIRMVEKNQTDRGSVHWLMEQGCSFEPVFIFTHRELQETRREDSQK